LAEANPVAATSAAAAINRRLVRRIVTFPSIVLAESAHFSVG
jgi:hypothetical protein